MQAIELESDITPDGHIQLPGPLRNVYGRHARLILLLDDRQPADSPSLRQTNDTEDFPKDIDDTDLGIDTPRRELD
jgi:hypothetical protein